MDTPLSPEGVAFALRRFIRRMKSASLAVALPQQQAGAGVLVRPHASLVTYACAMDGALVFLLSTLAEHTRILKVNPHVGVLIEDAKTRSVPQQGARLSIGGRVHKIAAKSLATEGIAKRFVARHPTSARYQGFGDFAYYRLRAERMHWVGGFAQARTYPAKRVLTLPAPVCRAMGDAHGEIVQHMNTKHAATLDLYANVLGGRKGQGWRMGGIDPDGADLYRGRREWRLDFETPVTGVDDCHRQLRRLARRARCS